MKVDDDPCLKAARRFLETVDQGCLEERDVERLAGVLKANRLIGFHEGVGRVRRLFIHHYPGEVEKCDGGRECSCFLCAVDDIRQHEHPDAEPNPP